MSTEWEHAAMNEERADDRRGSDGSCSDCLTVELTAFESWTHFEAAMKGGEETKDIRNA